ncbi:E3 SUMO-protein ligase ZBED1-like [Oncorhynchus tshawytscha]|uniref:BED-type domain-containing protein n=1 Tax=Oncorhynchus tshawytscha TaxID=74940 RepID=A0AAZ3PDL2_ONCTS|nr:zinc finger BED domain-containing protein 1 [Oncorhynchus kisutch]XP_024299872.1 E3 SUMO-protein ligase ZBED1-like [Oncorhynchus tshawytscha]
MEAKGASSSNLHLVAHPRAKSKVWRYFGFDTDADGCILHWRRIYCRICMTQIAYSGNTSNLSYHLEKNHPVEFCEFVKSNTEQMREAVATAYSKIKTEPMQQQCQEAILKQSPAFENINRRHNDLTSAIISFVCEGMYPVSVVEEPTFQALLRTADPRYLPPSRIDVAMKALPQRYNQIRDAVLGEVAGVVNCGVSTDLWQSQTQNRTYISLSMHSLNQNGLGSGFSMSTKCLKTFEVPEDNTAENITRALYEAFVEWGITHKVNGATTNGSLDIVKACSLLDLSVQMPCLGHTINRGMDEAFQLPRIDCFLGRCRKLVDYFQQSVMAMYLLREKQRQQGLAQCVLIRDRVRSWVTTLTMLQRLKEQQAIISVVLMEDSDNHQLSFKDSEWNMVEGLIGVLQPFKLVADMITDCRYPTISMVRPVLHMLLNTTLKAKEGDAKEVGMAKEVISKVLSSTYPQTSEIAMFLNVATFLDPRYKRLPFLSPHDRSQVESKVIEEAKAILEKQRNENVVTDELAPLSDEPPNKKQTLDKHSPSCSNAGNPLAVIFCQSGNDENQEELHAQVVEELSNFKSQKILGLNEDPLHWWSDRMGLFPTLPKVLQKYWCVPATSVPSHRLFSSSGTFFCGKRNRLTPAHVDQQVFLYENSRRCNEAEPIEDDSGEWGLGLEQDSGSGHGITGQATAHYQTVTIP